MRLAEDGQYIPNDARSLGKVNGIAGHTFDFRSDGRSAMMECAGIGRPSNDLAAIFGPARNFYTIVTV
jgi:hypothetical protein